MLPILCNVKRHRSAFNRVRILSLLGRGVSQRTLTPSDSPRNLRPKLDFFHTYVSTYSDWGDEKYDAESTLSRANTVVAVAPSHFEDAPKWERTSIAVNKTVEKSDDDGTEDIQYAIIVTIPPVSRPQRIMCDPFHRPYRHGKFLRRP
ncbi:MAG: hypothetical protein MMC33_007085 [Icmadophila ericetorum]|nr:hypothetical protein [Icmadophila ericetorum]